MKPLIKENVNFSYKGVVEIQHYLEAQAERGLLICYAHKREFYFEQCEGKKLEYRFINIKAKEFDQRIEQIQSDGWRYIGEMLGYSVLCAAKEDDYRKEVVYDLQKKEVGYPLIYLAISAFCAALIFGTQFIELLIKWSGLNRNGLYAILLGAICIGQTFVILRNIKQYRELIKSLE